jgi:hypothetical protein
MILRSTVIVHAEVYNFFQHIAKNKLLVTNFGKISHYINQGNSELYFPKEKPPSFKKYTVTNLLNSMHSMPTVY